jgi:hypothetical protein
MKSVNCFEAVFIIVVFAVLVVGAVLFSGWTLCHLWDWFVVTQFQVNSLSLKVAIGISVFVGFMTSSLKKQELKSDKDDNAWIKMLTYGLYEYGLTAIYLVVGYIIYSW